MCLVDVEQLNWPGRQQEHHIPSPARSFFRDSVGSEKTEGRRPRTTSQHKPESNANFPDRDWASEKLNPFFMATYLALPCSSHTPRPTWPEAHRITGEHESIRGTDTSHGWGSGSGFLDLTQPSEWPLVLDNPLDGACPVHQREVSSVFGLHSLGCWYFLPSCDHSKGLQALPNVPFGTRSPSVKDRGEAEAVTFQSEPGSSQGTEAVTRSILPNLGPTVSRSLTEPET